MSPSVPESPATLQGVAGTVGWSEARFRAMGTDVHLAVLGVDPTLLDQARQRIEDLEQRWSRFRPDSLLSGLNDAGGRPVLVDDETFDLITTAVAAWHGTGHRFDPTILDAVIDAGYDRTFEQLGTGSGLAPGAVPLPPPGCADILLDPTSRTVTLPVGTHLDLGGIGKGRTADLVAVDLLIGGAQSALVNLGGDLRIGGGLAEGDAYSIAIDDPADPENPATVVDLVAGALATSSRARRHWTVDGEERHHLIDPATGAPARTDVAAVTVIAHEATEAEIMAKAALVAGVDEGLELLADARVAALLITADRTRHRVGDFEEHER